MSLLDAVKLLGVPDWVMFSTDESEYASDIPPGMYKLIWRNETFVPVVILVNNSNGTVTGWDEGRSGGEDGSGIKTLPDNNYSLKNEERYKFYESKVNVNVKRDNIDYNLILELEKERKRLDISWKLLEKDYAILNVERDELVRLKESLGLEPEQDQLAEFEEKLKNLKEKIDIYKADKLRYEEDLEKYNESVLYSNDLIN
ncbi:MAG: hypothetical protein K9L30_02465 [Desulfobacterales bacterium]|nr:hypothetical protein [Desulfobacterales bacterium]